VNLRRISAAILVALVGSVLVALPAQATVVQATIDGITYEAVVESVESGANVISSGNVGPDLVIPNTVDIEGITYVVTGIGASAAYQKGLTSVDLPDGLLTIGESAFSGNQLTSVELPETLIQIHNWAFLDGTLTHVTIPDSVTYIGRGAFYSNALQTVTLVGTDLYIDSIAFGYNNLTNVEFPASLYAIQSGAFRENPNLSTVTFNGNMPLFVWYGLFGDAQPTVRFYHDAFGFSEPFFYADGQPFPSEMIPPAVVTFDANGHGTAPAAAVVRPNADVADPGALTAAGYTFNGWFASASGGSPVSFPYTATVNATLYAQWTPVTYAVTIDLNNGEAPTQVTAAHDSLFTPEPASNPGHTFDGWFSDLTRASPYNFPITVNGEFTIYAQWTINQYTVKFEPGNDTVATTATANYNTSLGAPAAPARLHYSFSGWFTAADGGTQVPFPYLVQDDATLYAQWEVDTHTVTFDLEDGTTPTTQTHDYGSSIGAPTAPTRIGYTFAGWFTDATDGTHITFPYTVAGDATLHAQWTINEYTLTFEPNNGDAATTVTDDYATTVGAPTTPNRASHAFTGWFTAPTGGTQVTFPYTLTGDDSLYAQWTALPASITAPATATAGEIVTVTGENFIPGETVEIWLLSTPTKLTTLVVGVEGTFSAHVTIPATAPAGAHHIEVRGSTTATMSSPVTVTSVLATTGADVAGTVALAAILTLAGVALTLRNRRTLGGLARRAV